MLTSPTHTPNTSSASKLQGWALVVDDHPLFCDALELTLRSVADFTDVATASSLEAALEKINAAPPPALILLDLNLPDVNGLDGLMRLRRAVENVPIIIVSSMTENSIIGNAIVAGARGFVPKHSPRSVFRDALNTIAAGEIYVYGLCRRTGLRRPPRKPQTPVVVDQPAGPHSRTDLRRKVEQANCIRSFHCRDHCQSACHRDHA